MTSSERRAGRYQRRKEKREAKRQELLKCFNYESVADLDNLYKAMKLSCKGVNWKASVQRYNMNYLRRILQTRKDLLAKKDIRKGFYNFYTVERGKKRHIQSVHITERVIQKSFCNNALAPHLLRTLIYDNGASVKGKGIHFAFKRIKVHLERHYRKYGREGYVLLIDYSNYFGNIQHKPLLDIYFKAFGEDERLYRLAKLFVKAFGDESLGLGSESSQVGAITYTNAIHHYIKEVMRIMFVPYMDDNAFFFGQKDTANETVEALKPVYEKHGVTVMPHKTNVIKLSQGFVFMKAKFSLTETGKIVVRPGRKSITRQRQKLHTFKKLYDKGEMTLAEIRSGYMSWRGYIGHMDSARTMYNMDMLFARLFKAHPIKGWQ